MTIWGRSAAGILALSFAASGAFVESASAATVTVKKGDDLQAAIDGAVNGDTIVVKAGTYGAVSLTGRTDLTISSTSIASVQSQYDAALSANPNNVIVLHLNGTFTVDRRR